MNPHSCLSDEIFGLRERVTACRKRMRQSRAMHKPAGARNQAQQIFSDPDSATAQAGRYTEDYLIVERLVEEQEVGIT